MKPQPSGPRAAALRTLLGTLVVLLAVATTVGPGRAQTTAGSPGADAGVRLLAQTPWVAPGGTFTMRLRLEEPTAATTPGVAIALRVHQSVTTRSAFDAAIDDELGGLLDQPERIPVAGLPRRGADVTLRLGLGGGGGSTDRGDDPTLAVRRPGVYPVQVSLTGPGAPAASFTTWLVVVDPDALPTAPLLLSMIWPVVAPPGTLPDGRTDPMVTAQMEPGGRLDRITAFLARPNRIPLSVIIGPETVDTWARVAENTPRLGAGLDRLRRTTGTGRTEVLPAPYVPIDAPSLTAAGLGNRVPTEYALGADTLRRIIGRGPARPAVTAFIDPVDDAVLDRLRDLLVTRVAVPETGLLPTSHQYTPARKFVIETGTGRTEGAATAPFVERLLTGDADPAVRVARVVAALAEVAYEEPGVARGLVVAESPDWNPDPATTIALLDALRGFPLVEPVTLTEFFDRVSAARDETDAVRRLAPSTPPAPAVTAAEYRAAAERLGAYGRVVGADAPTTVAAEQTLHTTLAGDIGVARARAGLAAVEATVRALTESVQVDAKRITLPARRASVPLTFENRTEPPIPVKVRVRITSDKLQLPEGDARVLELAPGRNVVPFTVEVRTAGTFPVTIETTSVDGRLQFGPPVRLTVSSSVYGGVGIVITIGALLFLGLWWGNHWRRARRNRRTTPPVPAP
ncbi:MAG: DUF6049 family protein [Actinomycetota bacterium]